MPDTLIDTNVLLDVADEGSAWWAWSSRQVAEAADAGAIVVNQIVYSELTAGFDSRESLDAVLAAARLRRDEIPWDAAYLAGLAFLDYRKRGGLRPLPLPDFFIAAHAIVRGFRLLTRDRGYYRSYFRALDLVTPESHP